MAMAALASACTPEADSREPAPTFPETLEVRTVGSPLVMDDGRRVSLQIISQGQVMAGPEARNGNYDGVHVGRGDAFDSPARAYIDQHGDYNLTTGNHPSFKFWGKALAPIYQPGLDRIWYRLGPVLESSYDPWPYNHNDAQWLWTPWVRPGNGDRNFVSGLFHHEYHATDSYGPQLSTRAPFRNTGLETEFAITYAESADNGNHFTPRLGIAATEMDPNTNPYGGWVRGGLSEPTNIVKAGGWYYTLARHFFWDGSANRVSACLLRNYNLRSHTTWQAYRSGQWIPAAGLYGSTCSPVLPLGTNVHGLTYNTYLQRFVAVAMSDTPGAGKGFSFLTSPDLVNWRGPEVFWYTDFWSPAPVWNIYPSIIDHDDAGRRDPEFWTDDETHLNFMYSNQEAYLYFVQWDQRGGPYNRALYRFKIRFNFY
jgi:hypothetical protein